MWGAEVDLRVCVEPVAVGKRLGLDRVERGPSHPSFVECGAQGLLVDQGASGDVDEVGAGAEDVEHGRADEVVGLGGRGRR